MRIVDLPSGTVQPTDQIAIDNSTNGARKASIQTYVQSEAATAASTAIANALPINFSESVASLPKTISDARITADHRVVDLKFVGASSPFVVGWTTSTGSIVFSLTSGTFSSCTFNFELEKTQ